MTNRPAAAAHPERVRYGFVWEDASVLRRALAIRPGDTVLSIASAGDNALALLLDAPARVVAADLSPAQLACLDLRQAAFATLDHSGLLEILGAVPSARRDTLYATLRPALREEASRTFWDVRQDQLVAFGAGGIGRFERYFELFRTRVLPLVHGRRTIAALLSPKDAPARAAFYERHWATWRWRLLFRVFFSRTVMGMLGRDKSFFAQAQGSPVAHLIPNVRRALVEQEPWHNPFLRRILTGAYGDALPPALRPDAFATIRGRLDRLTWQLSAIDGAATGLAAAGNRVDAFNLSDVFEYLPPAESRAVLLRLLDAAAPGARLAYWNMMVPRRRPDDLADRLIPAPPETVAALSAQDHGFFYRALVVERVAA